MSQQKTVLIVSPNFPPSSLPPAQRTRQFARWLPKFGWTPIVLTVAPEFYQEKLDLELLNLVPPDLEVIRTRAFRPKRPGGWGIGDLGLRSMVQHGRALRRLCRERKIDLIYLPCPPNFQLLLGRLIHAEFGIPYVVDYIDPWVSDWLRENARPFTKLWLAHLSSLLLEPLVIHRASHVTSVSEGTNTGILRRYRMDAAQFSALPYGGEPEVFEYLHGNSEGGYFGPPTGKYRLVYLGAMWEAAYATMDAFFDALQLLKQRRADLYGKLEVHFLGTTYRPDAAGFNQALPRAQAKAVADVVRESPERLPFLDAMRTLLQADGLLMLGSIEPHYTASRLLPYLHAKRPILAIFHEASDGTRLLQQANAGKIVTYNSVAPANTRIEDVYTALVDFLSDYRYIESSVDWQEINRFSAQKMTETLAGVFDQIISQRSRGRAYLADQSIARAENRG